MKSLTQHLKGIDNAVGYLIVVGLGLLCFAIAGAGLAIGAVIALRLMGVLQ